MLYIDLFGARMVCVILWKHYTSLIVIYDGCCSFLHESHTRQKLPKPTGLLRAMASGHVLRLCCRSQNISNAHKEHVPRGGSMVVYVSPPINITKSFQGNKLASET